VNTTVIHNTYVNNTVINRTTVNNVSYNGGADGVTARPTSAELAAEHDHHVAATSMQAQHEQMARNDRTMLASENHGRPAVAATARPGQFHGQGVAAARSAGNNGNRPNSLAGSNNNRSAAQSDRPPSARSNGSFNQNNSSRPNTATQNLSQHAQQPQHNSPNGQHPAANNQNPNHPNNTNGNANHPNTSRPPQQNHQQPPKDHENGGHPGGRAGH